MKHILHTSLHKAFKAAFFILLCYGVPVNAQNNCLSIYVSTEYGKQGDTVELAVSVKGFVNIAKYKFTLSWVYPYLNYVTHSSNMSPLMNQNFNLHNAQIQTSWADPNNQGLTLPDNTILFKIKYRIVTTSNYFNDVDIVTYNNPASIEVLDGSGKNMSYACIQGGATLNNISPLLVDRVSVDPPSCSGESGKIRTETSGGLAPFSYSWNGPGNTYFYEKNIEKLRPGFYRFSMRDHAEERAEAVVYIHMDTSTVLVKSSIKVATCELPDGCAIFNVTGGQKPYVFSWQDGASADTSRCDLPGGSYVVTVSDQAGCSIIYPFIVLKDTTLLVSLQSEFADCRFGESGKIIPDINKAGPFTYLWSTGDTSATLSNLKSGVYSVSVANSIGCKGYAQTEIKDYGVFDWDNRIYKYQNIDGSASDLQLQGYVVAQRARLPLTIAWDTGTRQEVKKVDESITWTQISEITPQSNGKYAVTISDADGCAQQLTYNLLDHQNQDLGPLQPQFFMSNDSISHGEVKIWGRALKEINKIKFGLECSYTGFQIDSITLNKQIAGLSKDCFSIYPFYKQIDFNWESPHPAGLEADSALYLFTIHFGGTIFSETPVDFVEPVLGSLLVESSMGEKVAFVGKGGYIFQGNIPPFYSNPYPFNLALPSCDYDGYRRIIMHGPPGLYPHGPYTYITYTQNPIPYLKALELDDLFFLKPGNLFFKNYLTHYALSVPPYPLPVTECVWPGDADNNAVVNHYDLLYLGLGMGHNYTARAEFADHWKGVESLDWPETTATRAVNFKNLDMDGNGYIEPADTAVLMQYWGKKTNEYDGRNAYVLPTTPDSAAVQTRVGIEADTLNTGMTVKVPLYLSANGLHGLAFCISYDPKTMAAAPRFEATNSWLGDPGTNLIAVQKDFPGQSRLDIALTRLDNQAAQGAGAIGYLVLNFKDPLKDSTKTTQLYVSNALGIEPSERLVSLAETRKEIVLRKPTGSSAQELLSEETLTLLPNPAKDGFRISCAQRPVSRVVLVNVTGAAVRELNWESPSHTVQIDATGLLPGAYFVQVFAGQSMVVKKVVLR